MPSENGANEYSSKTIDLAAHRASRIGGANPPGPPLQPPGGGGTYDGMLEPRVASLEADVKNIRENIGEMKADLKSVGKDLTELKVGHVSLSGKIDSLGIRIDHLPTFKQMFGMLTAFLTVIGLLVVFQGYVQKYVGPSSPPVSTLPAQKP